MADRITILDDVLPFGEVAQRELVPPGHRLAERHHPTVELHTLARGQIRQRYGHIVRGIDFQKSFHRFFC